MPKTKIIHKIQKKEYTCDEEQIFTDYTLDEFIDSIGVGICNNPLLKDDDTFIINDRYQLIFRQKVFDSTCATMEARMKDLKNKQTFLSGMHISFDDLNIYDLYECTEDLEDLQGTFGETPEDCIYDSEELFGYAMEIAVKTVIKDCFDSFGLRLPLGVEDSSKYRPVLNEYYDEEESYWWKEYHNYI